MRIWSIHPSFLDAKGLVALWREALLAQKVLQGKTKGYRNHPQLLRFEKMDDPVGAIASYLHEVCDEADARGYRFDRTKISNRKFEGKIPVTPGQLRYEYEHLLRKLEKRDPKTHLRLLQVQSVTPHPMFDRVDGEVEAWEVI